MEILIGKLQQDGMVKYIPVYCSYFDYARTTLKNFYSKENRVDALLKLGRLRVLGPSPHGNFRWGGKDVVHCCAEWRDNDDKRSANKFKLSGDRKRFVELDYYCKFLFENGQWTVIANGREENIATVSGSILEKDKSLKDFQIKELRKKPTTATYDNSPVSTAHFPTWKDMIKTAVEFGTTYFVFSQNKLINVINP